MTVWTRSAPSASTARARVSAESIPPDSPKYDIRKAVFVHIVPKPGLKRGVDFCKRVTVLFRPHHAIELSFRWIKIDHQECFPAMRTRRKQRSIPVHHHASPIEYQFVLPPYEVAINRRQTDILVPRCKHALTGVELVATIRRCVRHEQHIGACIGCKTCRRLLPAVLTDNYANPDPAKLLNQRFSTPARNSAVRQKQGNSVAPA